MPIETQRRITNFERATLQLLKLIETTQQSEDTLYDKLGIRAATLPLAGSTLHEFLEGLLETGYLTRLQDGILKLTPRGHAERQRLEKVDASNGGPQGSFFT